MIKLSDLLYGQKRIVPGSLIIDNDLIDYAHIRFYSRIKQLSWQKKIVTFLEDEYTRFHNLYNEDGQQFMIGDEEINHEITESLKEISDTLSDFKKEIQKLSLLNKTSTLGWYMQITGEARNTLKIICPHCGQTFIDIVFWEDRVVGEYCCFHCREYLKHKEMNE